MKSFFLETQRLLLRTISESDIPFMMELNSDPLVTQYTGEGPFQNEGEAREIVTRLADQFSKKKTARFLVCELSSGTPLGWCGLKWFEAEDVVDLGYRFLRRYWGQGFATEAAKACVNYAFEQLRLEKLVAHAAAENLASIHVLRKLGFKETGPTHCGGLPAAGFVLFREPSG